MILGKPHQARILSEQAEGGHAGRFEWQTAMVEQAPHLVFQVIDNMLVLDGENLARQDVAGFDSYARQIAAMCSRPSIGPKKGS